MRDETMSRDVVLSIFAGFLESNRMHIRLEEDNLFPEALWLLNDGDWGRGGTEPRATGQSVARFDRATLRALRHGILGVFPDPGAA